jgi:transposase-like protein
MTQAEFLAWIESRIDRGEKQVNIAKSLGVSPQALRRWRMKDLNVSKPILILGAVQAGRSD